MRERRKEREGGGREVELEEERKRMLEKGDELPIRANVCGHMSKVLPVP